MRSFPSFLLSGTLLGAVSASNATILINEVADKGSSLSGVCNNTGADWVELYYDETTGDTSINLSGYILHDDKGPTDSQAYAFPSTTEMNPGDYLVLCLGQAESSPQFGIGGTDQVTLFDNSTGSVVSTTGPLQGRGAVDVSFAYDESTDAFVYTSTATPGQANTITPLPDPETVPEMRARLVAQNEQGTRFFDMDDAGMPVEEGLEAIVDMHMTVDPQVWQKMYDDRSYEMYSPFESVTITALNDPGTVYANLTSPGRFRPKGQSTLSFGTCMNRTVPYVLDFDTTNATQTLWGVQRGYLRTHFGDSSFLREWAAHRMMARFGLPHLRTRTVRLHVNDAFVGVYSFMEAPDQDYVFQRSFPDYDPDNYGLYKIKTLSLGCGGYDANALQKAEALRNSTEKPPYSFERGDHRTKSPVNGNDAWESCAVNFGEGIANEYSDVVLAYVRADKDCGKMMVAEGIIDRDLGVKALDSTMETFITNHLADNACEDVDCINSNLTAAVDTTQFLRNFAVMAALLHQDSPLGNGNNYYLASTGSSHGWKIVQYDHNGILSQTTDQVCDIGKCMDELIHWSIERPTCRSLESSQIAGPLLTNETLREEYLEYLREFTVEVMGSKDVQDQIASHLMALKDHVAEDAWNDWAAAYDWELSDEDVWLREISDFQYIPFLPAMRVRSADIMKQLEALENGTFPRDLDEINAAEVCVNWKSTDARESACPRDCAYDGCVGPDFDISGFCNVEDGICYQGVVDVQCKGIEAGLQYEGMEPLNAEKDSFCWGDPTLGSTRLSECPDYQGESSGSAGILQSVAVPYAIASFLLVALFSVF